MVQPALVLDHLPSWRSAPWSVVDGMAWWLGVALVTSCSKQHLQGLGTNPPSKQAALHSMHWEQYTAEAAVMCNMCHAPFPRSSAGQAAPQPAGRGGAL